MSDIKSRFLEVEQRVRDLVTDNKQLRGRVLELEKELADMQGGLQEFRKHQGQRGQIRERLERILSQLEQLRSDESIPESEDGSVRES